MESAPVTTAPFQFKWQGIAQHVYDEYLSKPYTSPTIPNDWEYTHGDVTIPRPNHSLTHTLRTATYVSEVVKAYNCFHQPPLTSKDIDRIQISLLFYVVGRENEASFGNSEYIRFRQKSADAFEKYVRKYLSAQFTEDELQFYKTGIYNAYSSAPAEYIIIRICHELDLIRCYTRDKYNEKLKEAAVHIGPHATPLAELAEECLQRTGDRIMDKRTYEGLLFIRCSTSVEAALQKINEAFQHKQGVIMQPVQSSIPPDLKAPVPKTPWNVSTGLFTRIQNAPDGPFKKCEVLPTDPECAFVVRYFMHQKPHNYTIKKIYCIHNPDQTSSFEAGVKIIERETENSINAPKGKTEEPKQARARAIQRWQECTSSFSPVKIKGLKRTDKYTEVKVLPLWHGTNEAVCQSVCTSGFTSFGKHHYFTSAAKPGANASTDIGYFGSGIYFTNSAQYAAMYSSGHLLLSWVSMREPYPVVNDVPHPSKGSDMKKLAGQGHYQNYNAHYIPVASTKPHDASWMEYYPCHQNQTPTWDEIVVFDKNQTLPRFWIELAVDSPEHPLKSPFTAPVSVVPTAPASTTPALVPKTVLKAPTSAAPALVPKADPYIAAVTPPTAKPVVLPLVPFGKAEWEKYIGKVGAEPPLPHDIDKILNAPCPFWPNKKVYETHVLCLVPQTVNGQPLTLKLLGELIQKPLQGHAAKYHTLDLGGYPDPSAPKSRWALMTRAVVEGSLFKSFKEQQTLIASFSQKAKVPYEVPTILDANVCILMEYVRTGTRLYSDKPWTVTRCQEKYNDRWRLVVGGFALAGPRVDIHVLDSLGRDGVAGLRKF